MPTLTLKELNSLLKSPVVQEEIFVGWWHNYSIDKVNAITSCYSENYKYFYIPVPDREEVYEKSYVGELNMGTSNFCWARTQKEVTQMFLRHAQIKLDFATSLRQKHEREELDLRKKIEHLNKK